MFLFWKICSHQKKMLFDSVFFKPVSITWNVFRVAHIQSMQLAITVSYHFHSYLLWAPFKIRDILFRSKYSASDKPRPLQVEERKIPYPFISYLLIEKLLSEKYLANVIVWKRLFEYSQQNSNYEGNSENRIATWSSLMWATSAILTTPVTFRITLVQTWCRGHWILALKSRDRLTATRIITIFFARTLVDF